MFSSKTFLTNQRLDFPKKSEDAKMPRIPYAYISLENVPTILKTFCVVLEAHDL